MELSQKYAYKIYRTNSFSKAAKALYISQPSLSATIKKLEAELGFTIFDRSKTPLSVTPEGAVYMEYLEKIFENEAEMEYRIKSLANKHDEHFYIGGGNYLSQLLLPKACGELKRAFPDIRIKIDMNSKDKLDPKLEDGTLDCIIAYVYDKRKYIGIPFLKEPYFVAMRRDAPGTSEFLKYAVSRDDILSGNFTKTNDIPYSELAKNVPLLNSGRLSSAYVHLQSFMEQFTYSSCQIMNSRSMGFYYDLMLEGMGAAIISDIVIASKPCRDDEVIYVPVNASMNTRCAHVVYKKSAFLSECTKKFIEIVTELGKTRSFLRNLFSEDID